MILHFLNLGKEKIFASAASGLKIQLWEPNCILTNTKTEFPTPYFKGRRHYFYPSTTAITLLLDEPGWLIAHHKLYTVKNNSKKLRLLTKKVEIPSKLVPDYFEKFIKDIAKKSRHKRHGF
jgi:non-specific serine/threonine protein kinase